MSSTDYRRKSTSREDPRLARRESTSIYDELDGKSKQESPRNTTRDPRIREDSTWRGHEGYNQPMQTAYQHLPTSLYSDVCWFKFFYNVYLFFYFFLLYIAESVFAGLSG